MTERYTIEESENQLTIFDNESSDDYYHLGNDEEDVKAVCDKLNEFNNSSKPALLTDQITSLRRTLKNQSKIILKQAETIKELEDKIEEYDVLSKQLNIQTGSLTYLKMIAWDYKDILHISRGGPGVVNVYVRADYDSSKLRDFQEYVPLGVKCIFIVVEKTFVKELDKHEEEKISFLLDCEVVSEQKELQKLIYTVVGNMIDDKIKEINEINEVTIIPRESITVLEELKTELQGALK